MASALESLVPYIRRRTRRLSVLRSAINDLNHEVLAGRCMTAFPELPRLGLIFGDISGNLDAWQVTSVPVRVFPRAIGPLFPPGTLLVARDIHEDHYPDLYSVARLSVHDRRSSPSGSSAAAEPGSCPGAPVGKVADRVLLQFPDQHPQQSAEPCFAAAFSASVAECPCRGDQGSASGGELPVLGIVDPNLATRLCLGTTR